MVVFACNACGESLKKNQVEKHCYRCRGCNMLSCLDCGKDFWGNDYEQHTRCISEEEKYSGKNFVPRPGANKNEIKQQQWFYQVQQAIEKAKTNPQLRTILERLKDYPNVPRKEAKFINFLKSSLNCRNPGTCTQAWKAINEFVEKPTQQDKSKPNGDQSKDSKVNETVPESAGNVNGNSNTTDDNNQTESSTSNAAAKKLSKREKKEERRKKAHKSEKKDKQTEEPQESGSEEKPRKKKRKRDVEDDIPEEKVEDRLVADNSVNNEEEEEEEESSEPVRKKFKTKFDWAGTVVEVLQSKGPEMKIKKLRKKVLSEYLSQGCTEKSEETLWAKFDKKVKRIPGVKIAGDKVKLTKLDS